MGDCPLQRCATISPGRPMRNRIVCIEARSASEENAPSILACASGFNGWHPGLPGNLAARLHRREYHSVIFYDTMEPACNSPPGGSRYERTDPLSGLRH